MSRQATAVPVAAWRAACAGIARRHDRERYLISLFARQEPRDDLMALLAANHEIARTAEAVSEATFGMIRLQWWREALLGIAEDRIRQHEVVTPLAVVAHRHPAILGDLRRVIDAREADLEPEPFADLEALLTYSRETGGALTAAMARVLGVPPEPVEALGTAWALIGLVRALPYTIAQNRVPLPVSLLKETDINSSKLKDQFKSVELNQVCGALVYQALMRLEDPVIRAAIPLRLLHARAVQLATILARHDCDPRAAAVQTVPPGLVWRHAVRGVGYRLGL